MTLWLRRRMSVQCAKCAKARAKRGGNNSLAAYCNDFISYLLLVRFSTQFIIGSTSEDLGLGLCLSKVNIDSWWRQIVCGCPTTHGSNMDWFSLVWTCCSRNWLDCWLCVADQSWYQRICTLNASHQSYQKRICVRVYEQQATGTPMYYIWTTTSN